MTESTLDENAISVPCAISGCFARIIGDTYCHEHGGQPSYEWRVSDFGDVEYDRTDHQPESKEPATS